MSKDNPGCRRLGVQLRRRATSRGRLAILSIGNRESMMPQVSNYTSKTDRKLKNLMKKSTIKMLHNTMKGAKAAIKNA